MKYYNHYNPYKFILFFPVAIIAGLVYFIFESWGRLDNTTLIILIMIILACITFLGYHISKSNHPLRGVRHSRGEVDDIVQKVVEQKKGTISEEELKNLRLKALSIYDARYSRAERAMKMKFLIDEFLEDESGSKKYRRNGKLK